MTSRSGGPRTPEGKAVTRFNATTFGLCSESPALPNVEDEEQWFEHRRAVFHAIAPADYLEAALAERVALILWRFKRLVRYEREQVRNRQAAIIGDLALAATAERRRLTPEPHPKDLARTERWLMDRLIPEEKQLNLLMRYEGRLHRHLLQLLHELEAMKARRRGEPAPLARLDIQGLPDALRP